MGKDIGNRVIRLGVGRCAKKRKIIAPFSEHKRKKKGKEIWKPFFFFFQQGKVLRRMRCFSGNGK